MKIKSSAIKEVRWNPIWTTVTFTSGKKYQYFGIGYKLYKAVTRAESVGREYNLSIKGRFHSVEVA